MSELIDLQTALQSRFNNRSMGLKLIVICVLALLMSIPAFFVSSLIYDRTQRAADVAREISGLVGGKQTFLGPVLAIPYSVPPILSKTEEHGVYIVFPTQGIASVKTHTEERKRSLFKVPVYQSDMNFEASFDLNGVPSNAPALTQLDWSNAEIIVGASDARGATADSTLSIDGQTRIFVPATNGENLTLGANQDQKINLTLFGVRVNDLIKPNAKKPPVAKFRVRATMHFSGAQRMALLAFGKTTTYNLTSDWPNPSFNGGFLPVKRNITKKGFTAEWSVPFIARGVADQGRASVASDLVATSLGVTFAELADPYQSVNRAVKYTLLLNALVFLSYFIFEVTSSKRVHAAQYIPVGIVQVIFYLLLLALTERTNFVIGFSIAASATVLLLSANAVWIFKSRRQGLRALISYTLLYSFIYLLLRLEEKALLIGAIASFIAVAIAMYFTRKIDWYSSIPAANDSTIESAAVTKSGVANYTDV